MPIKCKIKKNDNVVVLTGKDKGKTGMVRKVMPKESRVIVVGVNRVTRHVKPSQADPQGGRKLVEAPIHISNVALIDPKDGVKPTRAGYRLEKDGIKVRYAKRSGEVIG
ncbi:MAG: 50S ribosomal protein L24 [Alphaproteobacteria bacterium]|nr:50S ribosomal protein L24 [Alphaproteobacteria bacterium]